MGLACFLYGYLVKLFGATAGVTHVFYVVWRCFVKVLFFCLSFSSSVLFLFSRFFLFAGLDDAVKWWFYCYLETFLLRP